MRPAHRSLRCVGLSLAAACLLVAPPDAAGLGRLFSTPQERAQLDAMRRRAEHEPPGGNAMQPEQVTDSARLRVDGLVVREHGPDSVWINGEWVNRDGTTREGIRVLGEAGGRVKILLPHGTAAIRLKAGQHVDLATGTVRDAYEADDGVAPAAGPPSGERPGEPER